MEDFSNFIHEEIFLIDTYRLAVVANNPSDKDKILLDKILTALKLDTSEILIATTYQPGKSNRWVIFAESFQLESVTLEFYQPCKIDKTTFVLAQPLPELHESQEGKQKLWNVLKVLV